MTSGVTLYSVGLAAAAGLMVLVWIASLVRHDASLVDRYWGLGFVLVAWVALWIGEIGGVRQLLVATLVTVWGVRLSTYITWRNWGEGEDYRYRAMRERGGAAFPIKSLITVFLLQAVILWLVAAPVLDVMRAATPEEVIWLDWVALAGFGVGLTFEAVGDWQMARFKADPSNKGKVLDSGLWRYTRHPNYFGDAVVWWSFYVFAVASGGWWTVYGPVVMTVLLMKVSGVALLERNLEQTKPRYRDYVARTNAFFPWIPKHTD